MFSENSRYAKLKVVETLTPEGRKVKAISLRRLPQVSGEPTAVKSHDRLDIIAHRKYGDATLSHHIADANTALDAQQLTAESGSVILIPEK